MQAEEVQTQPDRPRILVIDDDSPIRRLLRTALEREGFEVEEAPDGMSGIIAYQRNPTDLIITDIIMPGKEGVETIMELRRDYPDVKIIAMSGGGRLSHEGYLELARRLGADDTMAKPFQPSELLKKVNSLLQQ